MLLVGSIVVALFDGLNTLMPVYVRDVLDANPTATVYILAPGAIGFLAGSALGPWLMDRRGERALGVMSLMLLSLGFVLFGVIELVAPLLAPFSPLRLLGLFGISLSPEIEAAGLISIFTALGSTGAGAAVQTYVNRYVILARQATTFGMQEVLDNALTLFAVLVLGALATAARVEAGLHHRAAADRGHRHLADPGLLPRHRAGSSGGARYPARAAPDGSRKFGAEP